MCERILLRAQLNSFLTLNAFPLVQKLDRRK